jgi:hypothetical protein
MELSMEHQSIKGGPNQSEANQHAYKKSDGSLGIKLFICSGCFLVAYYGFYFVVVACCFHDFSAGAWANAHENVSYVIDENKDELILIQ